MCVCVPPPVDDLARGLGQAQLQVPQLEEGRLATTGQAGAHNLAKLNKTNKQQRKRAMKKTEKKIHKNKTDMDM